MKFYKRKIKHPGSYLARIVPGTMLAITAKAKYLAIICNPSFPQSVRKEATRQLLYLWHPRPSESVIKEFYKQKFIDSLFQN